MPKPGRVEDSRASSGFPCERPGFREKGRFEPGSVRLDRQLRHELLARAEAEGTTASELIREALRRYLRAA